MQHSIWTFPWDVMDEGAAAVLDRIADDGGLNAISCAVSYHTTRSLLPHNPVHKVYYAEPGVYFRPDESRYGRIRPVVAPMVERYDVLGALEQETRRRGMGLIAWTVCLHNSALGRRYPECTVRNVFGDRYRSSLCPANEDVREYVRALAADLTSRYQLDVLELESLDYLPFEHGDHHEKFGVVRSEWFDHLMALCFCGACRKRALAAGIDIDRVAEVVREALTAWFANAAEPAIDALTALQSVREQVVTSLLEEVREAASTTRVRPMIYPTARLNRECGANPQRLAAATGEVMLLAYGDAVTVPELTGCRVAAGIQVQAPFDLVQRVAALRAKGIRDFSFYNYGLMRLESLPLIREALSAMSNSPLD